MTQLMKPLKGMRVLDFSKVLAGPICTQALGALGADVIKIEETKRGDDTRGWPPFREGDGAVFLSANRGKRSLALDLKAPASRDVVLRLAAMADVVVESFGPGVPERLGIDYAQLAQVNPKLVYCSISGFGQTGPMAHAKGYDMILQAFTGMVSMMGEPGGGPVRAPYSPVDQGTGMHAYSGILAALMNRDRTGKGCHIDVSLFDTGVSYLGYMFQAYWERGTEPARHACAHESLCPYEAFPAADKPVLIGVASEPLWQRFCEVTGLQHMVNDPRFKTNADRVRNRAETIRAVRAVICTQPSAHWANLLANEGIPCAQINTFADVLAHPHTKHSGLVVDYESSAHGPLKAIVQPVKFDGERMAAGTAPPRLGEHTQEVLKELGFSDLEIDALLESRVAKAGASRATTS